MSNRPTTGGAAGSGNVFRNNFMDASAGRGGNMSAGNESFTDDRTRVSDQSFTQQRVESGYRNMDAILANGKLSRGEMLEMLQSEFSEV